MRIATLLTAAALLVAGCAPATRVTLLPQAEVMGEVFTRIDRALGRRAEAAGKVVPIQAKARNAAA